MQLAKALRLETRQPKVVAFSGAGGKTRAILQLAHQLGDVLVSTTTHLGDWQAASADRHFVIRKKEDVFELGSELPRGVILFSGELTPDHRLLGVDPDSLEVIRSLSTSHQLPLLIEADGSRQHPIKAPAAHEPAIPSFAETVIVVAGLSALGQPLNDEWVHRPERFAMLAGLTSGDPITPQSLLNSLRNPSGGLKNIPAKARRICLLTQADTPKRQAAANRIGKELIDSYDSVLIADLESEQVHACIESCGLIILAGGAARRYGKPKQLLDWHGQPLIRHIACRALNASIGPVIVVTGAQAEDVESALNDLPLLITRCKNWEDGQSASIRAGLAKLEKQERQIGSAIFLLADQPYATSSLLRALFEQHSQNLVPVLAPMAAGRRANPVLFDRTTFSDLVALQGDVGGRALFSKYSPAYLPWLDSAILLDIDTPDDYRKLFTG